MNNKGFLISAKLRISKIVGYLIDLFWRGNQIALYINIFSANLKRNYKISHKGLE
tara:strand:- start:290 stop:454 length:165 start_codon:yes stop_codon:yes gene_type:complete